MATKATLFFDDIGGKTTTMIDGGKQANNDHIIFHNSHSTKELTIDFVPTDAFLAPKLQVAAGDKKPLHIKTGNPPGKRVKFTATLTGCTPDDPIIIIEK